MIAEDKEGQQLGAGVETSVRQSGGTSEAPERGRVLEEDEDSTESEEEEVSQEEEEFEEERSEEEGSEEENHTFEPTIETENELLPEGPTNLDAINTYFARINTPDSDGNESDNDLSDLPPSTPPSHPLNNNLQALLPQMQSQKLNPESLREAAESSSTFRAYIHANQLQANERSIRQYGKQRAVKVFAIGDKVSIAVPALDRVSTDDKRIFGQVIKSFDNAYSIQTKPGVLDRNYPTSELMSLPDTIELGIPEPPPSKKITLNTVLAKESTTEKVPVHCKCKDQRTWCLTRCCASVKAEVKCSIVCHDDKNVHGGPTCLNISSAGTRGQKGLKVRNREEEAKEGQGGSKQQRKDTVGKLIKSHK